MIVAGGVVLASSAWAQQVSSQHALISPQHALINQYCVTCHNEKAKTAGLMLDKLDIDHAAEHAETWEKVVRKLRGGMMPPQGMPRPEQAKIDGLITWLQTSLDQAAAAHPEPGRSPLHRLNRTEYANAIRDLLGLKVDVTALLPADDESNGFDNIAEVLRVSPSLLEAYLAASREVSSLAVGDPKIGPISQSIQVPPDLAQDEHIEGLPLGTRGGILIHHNFPLDADYEFNVILLRNIVGYLTGMEFPHQLEVSIDGQRVFLAPVGGEEDLKLVDTNLALAGDTLDARLKTKVHVKAGPHDVAVTFLRRDSAESDEPLQPFTRDLDLQNMNGIPLIDHVQITGPFNATGPGDTPSRRRIFVCTPASSQDDVPCAKKILGTLARRAYRRPVTDGDMETLLSFYQAGKNQGNFESGIENALRLILASPKFLFRVGARSGARGPRQRLSCQRSGSGVAAFVFPVEQHSRRRIAERGRAREAEGSGGAGSRSAAHAGRSESGSAGEQFRRAVAVPAQRAERVAGRGHVSRISTTICGRRSSARRSCSSTAS